MTRRALDVDVDLHLAVGATSTLRLAGAGRCLQLQVPDRLAARQLWRALRSGPGLRRGIGAASRSLAFADLELRVEWAGYEVAALGSRGGPVSRRLGLAPMAWHPFRALRAWLRG